MIDGRPHPSERLLALLCEAMPSPCRALFRLRFLVDGIRLAWGCGWSLLLRTDGHRIRVAAETFGPEFMAQGHEIARARARQALRDSASRTEDGWRVALPATVKPDLMVSMMPWGPADVEGLAVSVPDAGPRCGKADARALHRMHRSVRSLYSLTPSSGPACLTCRERDVLGLLCAGHREAEVARQLSISPNTVHNHAKAIYAKLGVHDRAHLVARFPPGGQHEVIPGDTP